jgi:hypothetical protein
MTLKYRYLLNGLASCPSSNLMEKEDNKRSAALNALPETRRGLGRPCGALAPRRSPLDAVRSRESFEGHEPAGRIHMEAKK